MSKRGNAISVVVIFLLILCIVGITKIGESPSKEASSPSLVKESTVSSPSLAQESTVSSPSLAQESSSSASGFSKFSDDNDAVYVTVVQKVANNYYNIKFPFSTSEYSFMDFDDDDDGKVMCSVSVTVPGQADKQELWCVFDTDGEHFNAYYLTLGDDLKLCDSSVSDIVKQAGLPVE